MAETPIAAAGVAVGIGTGIDHEPGGGANQPRETRSW